MNVRMEVAVPLSEAAKINERLTAMREELQKQIVLTERKIKAGGTKAVAERIALIYKLNRLTSSNLTRVVTSLGVIALSKVADADLLAQVVDTGLVRGRRKHAA